MANDAAIGVPVNTEEGRSSREWSPRPLGPVEIPGTVAECGGRFRMVYWKSTGKSYSRFPAVVRPLFSQNIVKTLLCLTTAYFYAGAPAELAFI